MKSLDHVNIDSGNPLCPIFNNVMDTLKKVMEINTWFLLLQTRTKKY